MIFVEKGGIVKRVQRYNKFIYDLRRKGWGSRKRINY